MENVIYDSNTDNSIGFYGDLMEMFKKQAIDAIKDDEFEEATSIIEYMEETSEHKNYQGLLVCSMNNGMGFTCKPYKEGE